MEDMSETSITGGCACGAVRYQSSELPGFSFHCQCRQCQRATGGGHASAFVLATDAVRITGEITFYDQRSDSGNTVSRGFCAKCGSPVMNKNSGCPGWRYFHAATLDDPSLSRPKRVLFRDAAQPWDHVDPDLP